MDRYSCALSCSACVPTVHSSRTKRTGAFALACSLLYGSRASTHRGRIHNARSSVIKWFGSSPPAVSFSIYGCLGNACIRHTASTAASTTIVWFIKLMYFSIDFFIISVNLTSIYCIWLSLCDYCLHYFVFFQIKVVRTNWINIYIIIGRFRYDLCQN